MDGLRTLFERAIAKRAAVLRATDTTCCRLFHGAADGLDGFVLERFGDVWIAQLHEGKIEPDSPALRDACADSLARVGGRAVYRKLFASDRSASQAALAAQHGDPHPWIGEAAAEEFEVREAGVRYRIRPFDGYSVGLFLDQRLNRKTLRERAKGRSVLNLFSYTCGFAVAAALGGATDTTNVDISKRYLEWGKRNFECNGCALDLQRFIASDVIEYYRRAERQGKRFDIVVLDPPSFARVKQSGKAFVLREQLDLLVSGAIRLLNPAGWLLLSANHRGTTSERLEAACRANACGRNISVTERSALPADFSGDEAYSKSVWLRLA